MHQWSVVCLLVSTERTDKKHREMHGAPVHTHTCSVTIPIHSLVLIPYTIEVLPHTLCRCRSFRVSFRLLPHLAALPPLGWTLPGNVWLSRHTINQQCLTRPCTVLNTPCACWVTIPVNITTAASPHQAHKCLAQLYFITSPPPTQNKDWRRQPLQGSSMEESPWGQLYECSWGLTPRALGCLSQFYLVYCIQPHGHCADEPVASLLQFFEMWATARQNQNAAPQSAVQL